MASINKRDSQKIKTIALNKKNCYNRKNETRVFQNSSSIVFFVDFFFANFLRCPSRAGFGGKRTLGL